MNSYPDAERGVRSSFAQRDDDGGAETRVIQSRGLCARLAQILANLVVVLHLSVSLGNSAAAQSCNIGISPQVAQRIFDSIKALPISGDYHFTGVGTEGPNLVVDWSHTGGAACPRLQIGITNCESWLKAPSLALQIPDEFLERCPGLHGMVDTLMAAVEAEPDIAPRRQPPVWFVPLLTAIEIVALGMAGLLIVSFVVGRARRADGPARKLVAVAHALAAYSHRGPIAIRLSAILMSGLAIVLVIFVVCEGVYRLKLRNERFNRVRSSGGFEIYGVGESTMVGEPFDPKISIPQILDYAFRHEIDGRKIVINNLGERGVPLYPQAIAFDEAVRGRDRAIPGVALILAGHNEKFGPKNIDHPWLITRLGEWSAIVRDVVIALRRRQTIGRENSLAMYEYYVRQVVETAKHTGLVPVLATMASNISRVEPNYVGPYEGDFQAAIEEGERLEAQGRHGEARDLYVRSIKPDDFPSAVLYYRAGRCEEVLGNFDSARELYWSAVDADPRGSFGRATRPQNELLRQLAREYDIPLVDTVKIFEEHSPHGLLGEDLIMDGQHPTLEGYVLMAQAYKQILQRYFGDAAATAPLTVADVATGLNFGSADMARAIVDSGSWLLATSVGHPFPNDRMRLATLRFTKLLDHGENCWGWVGIALSRGAAAGMLRDKATASVFRDWISFTRNFAMPDPIALQPMLVELKRFGVEEELLEHLRGCSANPPPR